MQGIKLSAATVLGCLVILAGCSGSNANERFQDCVLEKVTATTSQTTIDLLRQTCAKKYQVALPDEALKKLDGSAGQSMLGFVIHINNRNTNWIVTQVEFYTEKDASNEKTPYRHELYIEPLHEQGFWPSVPNEPKAGDKFTWGVTKAWGIPSKE